MNQYFKVNSRIAKGSKIFNVDDSGRLEESESSMPPVCRCCNRYKFNFEIDDDTTLWCCSKEKCIESFELLRPDEWRNYPLNFIRHMDKRNEFSKASIESISKDPLQEDFYKKWSLLKEGKIKDIYLSGQLGAGKTHCFFAAMKDVCKNGKGMTVQIMTENELYAKIKSTWDRGREEYSEKKFIDEISSVDFLFLDDLGSAIKTNQGDWGNQVLLDILDERLNSYTLRTVISSNRTIDELKDIYNDRICDRLKKMTQSFLSGESRRKSVNLEEKKIDQENS